MKTPTTNALRVLQKSGVAHEVLAYRYEEHGGTRVSARELGVEERRVVKTLIFQTQGKPPVPFIMLMHGDRNVSEKKLARTLEVKGVQPCDPKDADRYSGYHVGGTSPFGTRREMRVYAQLSIRDLPEIYINAGSRGLLVRMDPKDLERVIPVTWVDAEQ